MDGITKEIIIKALSPQNNVDSVFMAGEGTGKSGSFFFKSHCGRFIIKTIPEREFKMLKETGPEYYDYLKNN
jgi:hypothetical protein